MAQADSSTPVAQLQPRRRWFQFSLLDVLIAISAISVWLASVTWVAQVPDTWNLWDRVPAIWEPSFGVAMAGRLSLPIWWLMIAVFLATVSIRRRPIPIMMFLFLGQIAFMIYASFVPNGFNASRITILFAALTCAVAVETFLRKLDKRYLSATAAAWVAILVSLYFIRLTDPMPDGP